MFLTDDELEEFKKSNTFKMLVRGVYLGTMEREFSKMTKKQLVDKCFKKEAQIFDLKDKLALTEKALELACEKSNYWWKAYNGSKGTTLKDYSVNEFLSIAKEMMKGE